MDNPAAIITIIMLATLLVVGIIFKLCRDEEEIVKVFAENDISPRYQGERVGQELELWVPEDER